MARPTSPSSAGSGRASAGAPAPDSSRFHRLASELKELRERLREGGGPDKIEKQHSQGKLTARERIDLLLDPRTAFHEIGLLVAWDQYDGQAPGAGVVTGLGEVAGRPVVVVANDATVKAGSWWPETIKKMLRAQEVAMRCRVPIVYLVDSAGVNLPYQGGVFPGQYGASRIFHYNSIMRRYLRVPQIAAVMGPCIAGGAYLPALSDVILMVEGTSFMGLGGPNLVKGATGQVVESEELGGAWTHNAVSGVAHYRVPDDRACIARIRELIEELPYDPPRAAAAASAAGTAKPPKREPSEAYAIMPDDHRQPYETRELLECILDRGHFDEFQADYAPEMICGTARLEGIAIGVIANARGMIKAPSGGAPKFGGIVYSESAEKVAFFIETMNRHGTPLLFVQDVSGFMVGTDAEHSGIIRAGARLVEAMSTALVPKLVLTVNHASGAGYYAMAGQGFDPDFIFTWPTGRMGVMEGDSAVMALFSGMLDQLKRKGEEPSEELKQKMDAVRADYEQQLDARYGAARGFVDDVILPEESRDRLAFALRCALHYAGPHLGPWGELGSQPGR
ncbi:MAG TPA: acyl-CoA carboxylase subunit beta [Longimicrobiales bacterium]|nr:acyl-CoA carboxylase subunit beta [Longimicrobiales bacterium]